MEPVLHNKRGRDSERPAQRDEEGPPLAATRESPCTETKTQHSQKKKKKKIFKKDLSNKFRETEKKKKTCASAYDWQKVNYVSISSCKRVWEM